MKVRILGIDLTDNEVGTALSDSDRCFHLPTAICRDKKHDLWYIGEEAYEKALAGKGILTDKLLALSMKQGTATIRGVRYEALELLCRFLSLVREFSLASSGEAESVAECEPRTAAGGVPEAITRQSTAGSLDGAVIVLPDYDRTLSEQLLKALADYGFPRDRTFCVSRSESFLYYVMSQPRELRTGEVGLFDLSDQALSFYELTMRRDKKTLYVRAEKEDLDEAFTLSVLQSAAGEKLADKIMSSAAERLLKNKVFSGILLTGKGFEHYDWAVEFMRQICGFRRKVFLDFDIFARGALVRGAALISGRGDPGFVALCSGRAEANVSISLEKNGRSMVFPLIHAGDPVGGAAVSLRLLPLDRNALELHIAPVNLRKEKTVRIPMSFLPEREAKTCFVDFQASLRDERTMCVCLRDAGFGELFPATEGAVEEEVQLWD